MPGKSRRKRGRQPAARKAQGRLQSPGAGQAAAPGGSGRSVEASSPPVAVTPAAGVSSKTVAARQPVRYLYIGAELRTIGILGVLMLVTLVVLKLVLT